MIRLLLYFVMLLPVILLQCDGSNGDYQDLISRGEFTRAREVIRDMLNKKQLDPLEQLKLKFELERMDRIELDFTATREEILDYISRYIPDVTDEMIARWEESHSLEYMIIDGEKRYFQSAARNLFRIDPECRKIWEEAHKDQPSVKKFPLNQHIQEIIQDVQKTGNRYVLPVRLEIEQKVIVHPDVVPPGETIRCWIPFPRFIPGRQENIYVLKTDPLTSLIGGNETTLQRTAYLEKKAEKGKPTVFSISYQYTSYGVYFPIDPEIVEPVNPEGPLAPFLQEEPPHILFTPELRQLSQEIVGNERNPYLIARKLFAWIDQNIPWASAREYSTIRNISSYCYQNKHGDCGIKTLLFITLCRLNGIPARWQSGWEFQPPDDSMHDWGMIYFKPYGWVPMDVTYGLRESDDDRIRWFYLSGMDSYRLIFNDAYSQPFYPAKIYPRSETVDSQRGEVEWRGGNLYFDKWDWKFSWKVIRHSRDY